MCVIRITRIILFYICHMFVCGGTDKWLEWVQDQPSAQEAGAAGVGLLERGGQRE